VQTKQDYAYRQLKDRIKHGKILPGQRIVVSQLAHEIGTSAIPVREALLRLEADGLVDITPHVGAVVSHITGAMIERTLETLAVMEGYATRVAANHIAGVLNELEGLHETMRVSAEKGAWDVFSQANRKFHFGIYGVVDNAVLTKAIQDLWSQLDTYLGAAAFYLMPDRALGSVEEHASILAALKDPDRDLDELERLARAHKMNTARRLRPHGSSAEPSVDIFVELER
jgi:DNA-binding GntR family transcriptional regulator